MEFPALKGDDIKCLEYKFVAFLNPVTKVIKPIINLLKPVINFVKPLFSRLNENMEFPALKENDIE
jgi:hypothetical protein